MAAFDDLMTTLAKLKTDTQAKLTALNTAINNVPSLTADQVTQLQAAIGDVDSLVRRPSHRPGSGHDRSDFHVLRGQPCLSKPEPADRRCGRARHHGRAVPS